MFNISESYLVPLQTNNLLTMFVRFTFTNPVRMLYRMTYNSLKIRKTKSLYIVPSTFTEVFLQKNFFFQIEKNIFPVEKKAQLPYYNIFA